MIRAACEGCGAAFKAPDKLAGKRVKCPKCGEAVAIPAPDEDPDDLDAGRDAGAEDAEDGGGAAHDDAPAAAPVAGRRKASRGGARKRSAGGRPKNTRQKARRAAVASGGPALEAHDDEPAVRTRHSRVQRARRKSGLPPAVSAVLTLIVVVGIGTGVWFMVKGDPHGDAFGRGVDAFAKAQYAVAIAEFESIPADHHLHAKAQEQLDLVRQQEAAGESRKDVRARDGLHGNIERIRKSYVERDGEGHKHPDYKSATRYLLVLAQEFIDRFPDDPRADEVRGLFSYYHNVANLDDPITAQDVRVELGLRYRRWGDILPALAELRAQGPEQAAEADAIREEAVAGALAHWKDVKARIQDSYIASEQWLKAANETKKYLNAVEGLPEAAADAERMLEYAEDRLGG